MKFKKILSVLIASVVMLTALAVPAAAKGGSSPAMRYITTMELVRDMGIGINLGNTFEAFGGWLKTYGDGSVESYETAWGSPVITQKMIQGYAKEGFTTLRVPVHWFNLMDDNYNISEEYTAAVKQVVDWATDAGMYVIVNIHHDENNFFADFATNKKDKQLAAYKKIWTQLAEVFRDYGDRGDLCRRLQHRQPPLLVHGQLFRHRLGRSLHSGPCGAGGLCLLDPAGKAHGRLPAG